MTRLHPSPLGTKALNLIEPHENPLVPDCRKEFFEPKIAKLAFATTVDKAIYLKRPHWTNKLIPTVKRPKATAFGTAEKKQLCSFILMLET